MVRVFRSFRVCLLFFLILTVLLYLQLQVLIKGRGETVPRVRTRHKATLEEEIKGKLQKCFDSLNLSKFVNKGKALEDAISFIKLLKTVLPSPEQSNINSQSICWNISINLMLHSNDTLFGNINSHRIYININSDPSFFDSRQYYAAMLKNVILKHNGVHKKRLCIPRVFLAGFPKSGSTALDRMLTYHPKIEHGLSKEPRWWIPPYLHPNIHSFQPTIEYFVKYVLQQYKPPKAKYWVTNHDWVSKGENSQLSFDYRRDVHLQMSTWTRIKLKIFFKHFNKKLVQLLNDKNHSWSHSWQER
ncbi:PREDICTED: uncharacterized protein LOC109581208 [Amphimedon queenslandica]|uniref:Sulfotransferase domain-containing protein n=2 Tax=Amphimedon queenslandica TaxID=400682 RepID=A0AAN0J0V1_AMPQE|nr:PREDICTED: uncharacterized protein LOC109581208 [Amphimedon queenslandica]|eukprot:XP_019850669.1 PREDICTED: uncharacterized protein LOC109581208 [Amphimedon queenslandica]